MSALCLVVFAFILNAMAVVISPYDQWCTPQTIEMQPSHYCGSSAGCKPDPPGAASMALDPADASYPVAALGWPSATSPFPWGFSQTCFALTGSRDGPWPAGKNLNVGPIYTQLYDWAPITPGSPNTMAIMFDPYQDVCKPVWNITASAWPTCYIWAQLVECPAKASLNSGKIIMDFNQYNNGYTILVSFRNSRLGLASVRLTDSVNATTPISFAARTGASFILGDRKVNLPFTLYIKAINGEELTYTVQSSQGYPSSGVWGPSNFGVTYSISTNLQYSTNYDCVVVPTEAPTGSPTGSSALVLTGTTVAVMLLGLLSALAVF